MENKYENLALSVMDKYKEEFSSSGSVLEKDNSGYYKETEMNMEESNVKGLYNSSVEVSYEALRPSVGDEYDTISNDNISNDEYRAYKAERYAHGKASDSDTLGYSTGIKRKLAHLAGNQLSKLNADTAYETLAPPKGISNEYDTIRSGTEDSALERNNSAGSKKVHKNIIDAIDIHITKNNPDRAKSLNVKADTQTPKALSSEYERLALHNLRHQDEYESIDRTDQKRTINRLTSGKNKAILFSLVITFLVVACVTVIAIVFSGLKDEAVVNCPESLEILNGRFVNMTGSTQGDMAAIECNDGYKLNGSKTTTCLPNKEWSDGYMCEAVEKCVPFIAPENGFVDQEWASSVIGTKITIYCRQGYIVNGTDTVACNLNRTWSESPTCETIDCGIPSNITNGFIDHLGNTTVNSTFIVQCDVGYFIAGVETVSCAVNGTWNELPNCRPVSCGIPERLDNNTIAIYNDTTFGATVGFRCIDGFSLMGASFATCGSDGIWTQIPSCYRTTGTACEEAAILHDIVRRSRIYQADGISGNDPFVDDEYLSPDWYSVIFNGEQYVMPDVNTIPLHRFCGTENPVYLKDPHPNVTSFVVTATVCEKTSSSDCQNMHTIDVRKCEDNEIQYYLPRTNRKSGYCFDPPDIKNITEFVRPPDVQLGSLTVTPELQFSEVSHSVGVFQIPFLAFVCVETGGTDRSSLNLIYTTYWYVDDEPVFSFENEKDFTMLTENDLLAKGFGLGIMIRCAAKIASSTAGLKTSLVTSKNFFAGIQVSDNPLYLTRNGHLEISFQPTIPYGCYAYLNEQPPVGSCKSEGSLFVKDSSQCNFDANSFSIPRINSNQELCGFTIEGCYPYELPCKKTMTNATMTITTPFFSDADPNLYKVQLATSDVGTHSIWRNYKIKEITVLINHNNNYKNTDCYSHVDPHMKTADGRFYEINDYAGEFILYWNTENNITVQMKTVQCGHFRAYCTCAVSVQAGGDIFLINLCNDSNFVGMTSCKDDVLDIQKNSDLQYQDFKSISGLCGTFDSNIGNDFHTRNGTVTDQTTFLKSWTLRQSDENYLYPTCESGVSTIEEAEQPHACICSCYYENDRCVELKGEATCSPSQFLNCTTNHQRVDNLCGQFTKKCLTSR